MADWSDLTNDVLEYIGRLLSFTDHCRFSAVCRNWRSVSKRRCYPPAPQLPWLVLDEEHDTRKRKFYSLSEDKHYSIDIPELYGRYICGSSLGWFFAVDIKITGILINPFTRECYELPPLPAFSDDVNVTTLVEKVPSDYKEGPRVYTFEEMQIRIVSKAILSHDPKERSGFTVMIIFGLMNNLAFWRPGDVCWTVIDGPESCAEDIIYFKGNFYMLSLVNVLYVVDFEPEPKLREVGEIEVEDWAREQYLIDFDGNLFLILRFCECVEKKRNITVGFNVLEPNLEENILYECYDFDDYALFVGRKSSICINSSHLPKSKKDGIYFTRLNESLSGCDDLGDSGDLGVFDIKDKTISKFYSVELLPPAVGSPVWLTPNPW